MASKSIYFILLIVSLSLVVENADAGWKFWKKKKEDPTTTVAPGVLPDGQSAPSAGAPNPSLSGASNPPVSAGNNKPATNPSAVGGAASVPISAGNSKPASNPKATMAPGSPTSGTRGAIATAANPGLAIGVGSTGQNIRNNARPQHPNPGTEVGLDSGPRQARPGVGGNSGQGYRDWAVDLTGAGEGSRQPPKLPSQSPALGPSGQQQPAAGARPSNLPSSQNPTGNNGQSSPNPRPGSPSTAGGLPNQGGQVSPGQGNRPIAVNPASPNSPATGTSGGNQVSTLHVGSLKPGQSRPGSPASGSSSGYGSPGSLSPAASQPASPTGGKSWADVAGSGGNARPGSPIAAPAQPNQPRPGQTTGGRPTSVGTSGQTAGGVRTGTAVAGGAIAGAAIGGAAAGKVYSSNPTYSKGNGVTDDDLEKLAEALFIKDTNNANRYITLNLQKQTTSSNNQDQAPQPLMTVNSQAFQIPTIERVLSMYDNYKVDTRTNEYISPAQRNEESLLVDTFLSTNVMSAAMRFLADKGFVRKDYYDYKDTLRRIWFNLYSRGDGKIGSAGFEHVFLTELKLGTEVIGLHNWIYFNAEEAAKRADYLGYIKKIDLGDKASIVKIHAKYNNIDKPVTTMFIGTSPELEMALYTVCFFTRQERPCPVSLGGTKFNIQTHKFRYRGKDLIGSAYPDI